MPKATPIELLETAPLTDVTCDFCQEQLGFSSVYRRHISNSPTSRTLWESDHWYLCPTIGPLAAGHVLLLTKKHRTSLLDSSEIEWHDFRRSIAEIVAKLTRLYQQPVYAFEHGTNPASATGSCIEHAHLHLIPTRAPLLTAATVWRNDWTELHSLEEFRSSSRLHYQMIWEPQANNMIVRPPGTSQSQALRKVVAEAMGIPLSWNWRLHPRKELFLQTIYDWNCGADVRVETRHPVVRPVSSETISSSVG